MDDGIWNKSAAGSLQLAMNKQKTENERGKKGKSKFKSQKPKFKIEKVNGW